MRYFYAFLSSQTSAIYLGFALFFCFIGNSSALDIEQASMQVKTHLCKDNMTVDQMLEHSIKSHSQRDIGWRAFQEEDYFDVERAVIISKGSELHYRWRVSSNGDITPQNSRAEQLCQT